MNPMDTKMPRRLATSRSRRSSRPSSRWHLAASALNSACVRMGASSAAQIGKAGTKAWGKRPVSRRDGRPHRTARTPCRASELCRGILAPHKRLPPCKLDTLSSTDLFWLRVLKLIVGSGRAIKWIGSTGTIIMEDPWVRGMMFALGRLTK